MEEHTAAFDLAVILHQEVVWGTIVKNRGLENCYPAIALAKCVCAPLGQTGFLWAREMKNDPARLQGEPFGKYVWSVCVCVHVRVCVCVCTIWSKGNPVIVKVLNVFHLAILPEGEPECESSQWKPPPNPPLKTMKTPDQSHASSTIYITNFTRPCSYKYFSTVMTDMSKGIKFSGWTWLPNGPLKIRGKAPICQHHILCS